MLAELAQRPGVDVELLFSRQWLSGDGLLPVNAPLRTLPFQAFVSPERLVERSWKLFGRPTLNRFLRDADILYSPADTVFPRAAIPSVITLHDIHPLDPLYPDFQPKSGWNSQRSRWQHWVPKLFRSASAVLTVSEFCKQRMEKLVDTCDTPIHVVGNGVDPFFFELAELDVKNCRRPVKSPYVLVVGGLTDRKGAEETLKVASQLSTNNSEIRIVVIGQSEPRWAARASSYPNVLLLGRIDDELLGQYLRGAICLLFLSLYEGFGIPIIEAMAAGVPVVTSNTSSLPEIAGGAGLIFSPGESRAIGEAVERLAIECAERNRLIELGRIRASSFTWKKCVDRLENVFRQLL